jgi:hypothetical protein
MHLLVIGAFLAFLALATLLYIGDRAPAPVPGQSQSKTFDPSLFPKGASDKNYTILCAKKPDGKIKFTKTGPYVTCPENYAFLPVQPPTKLHQ